MRIAVPVTAAFIFEEALDLGVGIFDARINAVRYFGGNDKRVVDGLVRCVDSELDLWFGKL
jgi:hypothetical protein